MAKHLIEQIKAETAYQAEPIYTRGCLWLYEGRKGVWEEWPDDAARQRLNQFDGMPYISNPDKPPSTIKVTSSWVDSVLRILKSRCYYHDFFERALPQVAHSGGALIREVDGLIASVLKSPDNKAIHAFDFRLMTDEPMSCPRFMLFLEDIFQQPNGGPLAALIQEFVGACLFGAGTTLQRALLLIGRGANGKSVLMDVIAECFPQGQTTNISPHALAADHFKAAMFADKNINLVDESPTKELAESHLFKSLITGGAIVGRRPYGQDFQYRPRAGHIFSANEWPATSDFTDGYWRRLCPVPFNVVIPPEKRIPDLAKKIASAELPGIVAWFIDGAKRLFSRGGQLIIPQCCLEAHAVWQEEVDPIAQWLTEEVVTKTDDTPSSWPLMGDAYAWYKAWAGGAGFRIMSIRTLKTRLENKGIEFSKRTSSGFRVRLTKRAKMEW